MPYFSIQYASAISALFDNISLYICGISGAVFGLSMISNNNNKTFF
jgi:hypothetical protein